MKKLLSVLFCILLIFSLVSFSCSAADADTVVCSSVANSAGSTVTLPISYSNNKGIYVARIFVDYDEEVFEYVGIEKTLSETFGYMENDKNGVLTVLLDAKDLANYKKDGNILGVKLKIKDTAKNGSYEVKLSGEASCIVTKDNETSAESVALTFENGKIFVICNEHSFTEDVENGKKCANCDAVSNSKTEVGETVTVPVTDSQGNTSSIIPGDISTIEQDSVKDGENDGKEKDNRIIYVVVILSAVAVVVVIMAVMDIRKKNKKKAEQETE